MKDDLPTTHSPKTLRAIMRAHLQTREKYNSRLGSVHFPKVTLLLTYGYMLRGHFEDFDFGNARISFRVEDNDALNITYLNYDDIAAVTLHDLEDCPEFMQELSSID